MTLEIGTGEAILFAVTSVAMVAFAIYGLLITRKAVITTLSVMGVMIGLAIIYTALEAPFMGVVQVVVYTGAILMMFLFVLMLIGVDSADSGHETLKAQRPVAVLAGLGIAAILGGVALGAASPAAVGLAQANAETNPVGVAKLIFSNNILTLQLTGTLLIVAALGAMTLTHRDRVKERVTQEQVAHQKVRDFIEHGIHFGNKPNPGVYAESNSSTNPALTAGGQPVEISTNRVLHVRGQVRTLGEISPVTVERIVAGGIDGPSTYGKIGQATVAGMPGEKAPDYDAAIKRLESGNTGASPRELEASAPESDVEEARTIEHEDNVTEANTEKTEEQA